MNKTVIIIFFAAALMIGIPADSQASLLYDTGPGINQAGGLLISSYQWIGKRAASNDDCHLDRLDGWMSSINGGLFRLRVYSDTDSDLFPDTILGSWTKTISAHSMPSWESFDIDFSMSKNTDYWFYFETDSANGNMTNGATPPDSLGYYGWNAYGGYYYAGNLNFGVRAYGELNNAVPEPASFSLLGLGLAGLLKLRKKRV